MTTDQQAAPDPSRTEKPNWLTLDRQLALRTAASRLGEEFKGIYGPETIGRFIESSFDQFADRASVTRFLPLLACPVFPGERYEDWDIADPAGQALGDVRPIRDEVERRVLTLMSELGLTPAETGGCA